MGRLVVYYDGADQHNRGWAYSAQSADGSCESGALPHNRRDVSLATLARAVRREFNAPTPFCARVRALTRQLALVPPQSGGPHYEARS